MTRTILMMRHAKSSWDNGDLSDHERPLNKRGLRDAPRMGKFLASMKLIPDAIISSTAMRAITTATIVADNCEGFDSDVIEDDNFYLAPPAVYLERASLLDNSTSVAMFVGHNPGMASVTSYAAGRDEEMPTAAIARLDFGVENWAEIESFKNATVVDVWRPKEIDW